MTYACRHALSISCVVLASILANQYFSMSHEYWMVVSAFFVSQTTRGTPIRQGLNYFFMMVVAMCLSLIMHMYITNSAVVMLIVLAIYFIASVVIFIYRPISNKSLLLLLFPLILLLTILVPVSTGHMIYARFADVLVGGVLGIIINQLVYPIHFDAEFKQGLIPLLNVLVDYANELIVCLRDDKSREVLNQKRLDIEAALQSQQGIYPEWVYEVGFNPGLRGGFRFFLVNIEYVTELYFSLDYLARSGLDAGIIQTLIHQIECSIQKNNELLSVLIEYFSQEKVIPSDSDYTTDMTHLEEKLRQNIPDSLELLDISPEYVKLTAFVRDIKDIRELLLKLVMALPSS